MQAYKLKAKIDNSGNLVIKQPINMPPGEVEVIVLQPVAAPENITETQPQTPKEKHLPAVKSLTELFAIAPPITQPQRKVECNIPILKEWLELTQPAPENFDIDQAKWEYLKEKHNL
ncbi:MAG: hypothetical protein F6K40_15960 [Okeania sp. SIO3I5]|uniref:hypothetical protein n=1 Tax=Okeania sp. SIO3I5 TaxID=2607805 RepID=UPI0013BCBC9C|nr:hypothetical protein [Okeania sp. SIO3I5]NEQ37678.1 hypothetical protein [Okeania sp. SIO3I5]